jgi:hypothetical protein
MLYLYTLAVQAPIVADVLYPYVWSDLNATKMVVGKEASHWGANTGHVTLCSRLHVTSLAHNHD